MKLIRVTYKDGEHTSFRCSEVLFGDGCLTMLDTEEIVYGLDNVEKTAIKRGIMCINFEQIKYFTREE